MYVLLDIHEYFCDFKMFSIVKTRKTVVSIQNSDIEARIVALKKVEEPIKAITSSCTGSLELLIKHIDELAQPNSKRFSFALLIFYLQRYV